MAPGPRATGFRRLAETAPAAVPVGRLVAEVDRPAASEETKQHLLETIRRVAEACPADCQAAIPTLRSRLADEGPDGERALLGTLAAIADDDPGAIAPCSDDLIPALDSDTAAVRREAARCFAAVAEECPADALDAVPALATLVEDGGAGRRYAVFALSRVSQAYPASVKPVAETLADVLLDDSLPDGLRLNATAALGRVVGEFPSTAVDIVDDVLGLLDVDHRKLRNNAVALLADVALVHTDLLEPHTDTIAPLLTADDDYTRINASGVLSRVAEDFPASVAHLTDTFITLLEDDHHLVRVNACWALGHLRASDAQSALEARRSADDDQQVRERAAWALSQLA